jgi:hypothetical protein
VVHAILFGRIDDGHEPAEEDLVLIGPQGMILIKIGAEKLTSPETNTW